MRLDHITPKAFGVRMHTVVDKIHIAKAVGLEFVRVLKTLGMRVPYRI